MNFPHSVLYADFPTSQDERAGISNISLSFSTIGLYKGKGLAKTLDDPQFLVKIGLLADILSDLQNLNSKRFFLQDVAVQDCKEFSQALYCQMKLGMYLCFHFDF